MGWFSRVFGRGNNVVKETSKTENDVDNQIREQKATLIADDSPRSDMESAMALPGNLVACSNGGNGIFIAQKLTRNGKTFYEGIGWILHDCGSTWPSTDMLYCAAVAAPRLAERVRLLELRMNEILEEQDNADVDKLQDS